MMVNIVLAEDENSLISRAQNGDREAFCELVRQYRIRVIHIIYRICGDADLAEDAAQMAFVQAWSHLKMFHIGTSLKNWLYRIAVNASMDLLRREKPQKDIDDVLLAAPGEGLEKNFEKRERARRVRQAILSLPQASRVVLTLREYENLSYQEIAHMLEIPTGTVMSRLNYARNRLAEILHNDLEEL